MAGIIFSKSSGLNDSIYGKSEAPIRAFLEQNVKAYEEMSTIKKIFKMIDSEHYGEKFGGITGFAHGFQPVGEGGSYPTDERPKIAMAVVFELSNFPPAFSSSDNM